LTATFFLLFIRRLNVLGIRYMVTGSVASIAYGEARPQNEPSRSGSARSGKHCAHDKSEGGPSPERQDLMVLRVEIIGGVPQ
jgi:hypothetical protein